MYKFLIPAILLAVISGCGTAGNKQQPPIAADVMQRMVTDIHLAEAYSTMVRDSAHNAGEKNPDSLALYYRSVFARYNISPEQFVLALNWYKAHPEQLDTVYTSALPVLTRMQANTVPATPALTPQPPPPAAGQP